ncbi:MAG: hypothetical protein JXL84_07685 [Deltaproteobacteria bacterium]|nr:hypothetical protein [Deltaproteobacteria bacterium]
MNTATLHEVFLAFREQCIWIRCCYNTYVALYDSGTETSDLLSEAANIFFGDLNKILREYWWLQVSKITDPPVSRGRENLTVQHINTLLCSEGLMTAEISSYSEGLMHYRKLIKEGRDRLISHLDKESVLKGGPIGDHATEDVTAFLENLQRYVDAVGAAVGVGRLDFRVTAGRGDVIDLIAKLKGGV